MEQVSDQPEGQTEASEGDAASHPGDAAEPLSPVDDSSPSVRRPPGWLVFVALVCAYTGMAIAATWPMVTDPDIIVLGDGELGGWLWRYWLMKLEIAAILEEIPGEPLRAFFTIISLGRYPETGNVLDLLAISLPLEQVFGHPAYYNVKCVFLIVTNCLAGYAFFHHLSRSRLVAFVAGVTFGFNSFVFYEIFTSGLRQATMLFIPLYALALEKTLSQRRYRHAVLAGILLAMVAIFYWFNGLFAAMYTGLRLLWHLWERRRALQLKRLAALMIVLGLATAPIAGVFMWPYIGSVYQDPSASALPEVQWFTDFPTLEELEKAPQVPVTKKENLLASLARGIPSSWSMDWIFNPFHQRNMPLVMGILAVGVALFRLRAVGFWFLAFAFFYVMTGGPYLRLGDSPGGLNFVLIADTYAIRMPWAWAFKYVPMMSRMFAPYRMGCMVMLAFGALLALNMGALMKALSARWMRVAAAALFLGLYFGQFFGDAALIKASGREGFGKDRGLPLFTSELRIHPFYDRLSEEPPGIGVIHLPLQYQQDLTTYYQTIHEKKVLLQTGWANAGALPPLLRELRDPKGGTTPHLQYLLRSDRVQGNTFIGSLLALNNPPHSFPPYRAEDVGQIYTRGYRYILLHERGCYLVRPDGGTALYAALRKKLIRRFGDPVVQVKEFTADASVGNRQGHVISGVELGWSSAEPPLIPSKRPLAYHLSVFRIDNHVLGLELPGGYEIDAAGIAGPGAPKPEEAQEEQDSEGDSQGEGAATPAAE